MGNNGEELKAFNVRDGYGIRCALTSDIEVAIITGRKAKLVEDRCATLGITHLYQGQSNKLIAITRQEGNILSVHSIAWQNDNIARQEAEQARAQANLPLENRSITLQYADAGELAKAGEKLGWAALQYVQPGTIVGVGTGSTAAHFIDALGTMKGQIEGAVSSSDASTEKLKSLGIHVFDLNEVDSLGIYVDGADEINGHMQMIKGGGAALTREKIIASVAEKFICIADASKQVDILGKFPLPVEVIPMARSAVARQLVKLGGRPEYRQGVVTDNGNVILDVHGMEILDPIAMENAINAIPGVVTVGLFANRGADVALIGTPDGVKTIVK